MINQIDRRIDKYFSKMHVNCDAYHKHLHASFKNTKTTSAVCPYCFKTLKFNKIC